MAVLNLELLLASLPVGIGLTTTGARTPTNHSAALNDLITLIDQTGGTTEANEPDMIIGGQDFLDRLAIALDSGPLIINSVTLSATGTGAGTTAGTDPITLRGVASDNQSNRPVEAIVIDTRQLPAGTILELENLEFVVVIGQNIQIRGGEGANIFFAGDGSQNIKLGAGDDKLYAGNGDDWIGSAAGNDWIYGEAGNDILYGGTGNDFLDGGTGIDTALFQYALSEYHLVRLQDGTWSVNHPIEGQDVLAHIEFAEFADRTITLTGLDVINQWAGSSLSLF